MKNVTVTLPEDTVLWLPPRAAEADRSASSSPADVVEEMRGGEDDYQVAMARALARKPREMVWVDDRKPTRDELYRDVNARVDGANTER